jgi:hypothetical protein
MRFRDRFLSIFDNVITNFVVYFLSIAIPIIIGIFFHLGIQTTLLILVLIVQILISLMLFDVRKTFTERHTNKTSSLVKNIDNAQIYLVDQYQLPHPISDKDTALYFAAAFGYQLDEIPHVDNKFLKPVGTEITSLRNWHPPRTVEDEMSAEAQRSIRLMKKYIRSENGKKILSFCIRNNSDNNIQINTAKLVFDSDAPMSVGDISSKNKPLVAGLLECSLMFGSNDESQSIPPQQERQADLYLKKSLMPEDGDALTSVRLGYIRVKGFYRDTQIEFHLYV